MITSTTNPRPRILFLDALRGFALLGIAAANYPEFSLFDFLPDTIATASDHTTRFWQTLLVSGKFYTLFSILFGIGFSIIMDSAMRRGVNGLRIFYRRMTVLTLIGLAHLLFLWSGDILLLYALMGMLLPLFRHLPDRQILTSSVICLLLPIPIEAIRQLSGHSPADNLYALWWQTANSVGITTDNFATWLRDATSYADVFAFLRQGAVERMWEFVSTSRYFKVLGLFLFGLWIGRKQIVQNLSAFRTQLRRVCLTCFIVSLPLNIVMALHPTDNSFYQSIIYCIAVYPMGLAYATALALIYLRLPNLNIWHFLAAPGRMALTCYILQTICGMIIFYGIGFALGAELSLGMSILTSTLVFVGEAVICHVWLRRFAYGPLEWIWRMLTYGKRLPLLKRQH